MGLPFSRDAFLDVFAAYHAAWWPVALALWIVSVAMLAVVVSGRDRGRWTVGLLALQWAWAAAAYHAALFSRINPAAWAFAAGFAAEAALLLWYGTIRRSLTLVRDSAGLGAFVGYGLIAYGLMYPAIAVLGEDAYPRVPTFGVPCPTVLLTIGVLMLTRPVYVRLAIVPLVWAGIGGSGAFLLGMRADLALPIGGVALAIRLLQRPRAQRPAPAAAGRPS